MSKKLVFAFACLIPLVATGMVSGSYQSFAYRNGMWISESGSEVAEPVIGLAESFWMVKPNDWEQLFSVWP